MMKTSRYQLLSCALYLLNVAEAFDVRQLLGLIASPSSLSYQVEEPNHSLEGSPPIVQPYFLSDPTKHRDDFKRRLAIAAIENCDTMEAYNDEGMTSVAEDIMKCLELVNPSSSPAYHSELNARWSFVFTGVPTIGMRLITLLSRISVGVSVIDFRDVFLEVSRQNTQVKAIVAVKVLGMPVELNVYTKLEPKLNDNPKGTFLVESFQKLVLAGVEIPTPEQWKTSRDLEISYLDQDMMIARTAGGEPHFLLRHSPCSTDDDACDIDSEVTEYFQEARATYGTALSRSLVDRAYDPKGENRLDVDNIIRLVQAILEGKNGHS
jgi:hypothetical protein